METIVDAVLIFVDGKDPKKDFHEGVLKGQAIECSGLNHYYQMQPEYSDAAMKAALVGPSFRFAACARPAILECVACALHWAVSFLARSGDDSRRV